MNISDSTYISFIEVAKEVCEVIPLYFSKFSKRTYNNHQKIILLVMKQKLKCSYAALIEDLKTRPEIVEQLGLNRLPHDSTLKKFAKQISTKILHFLLGRCVELTRKRKLKVGIDATGFHVEDGSYFYRKRLGLPSKTRKNVKLSASVETDKQLILAARIRKSRAHDTVDFKPLMLKTASIKEIKVVTGDKAYDSEENRRLMIEDLNAECQIPVKGELCRHPGFYRKRFRISKKKYHRRSLVETVFFVVKRLFGAVLYAKSWMMQKKELLFKCIAYNIHRLTRIL